MRRRMRERTGADCGKHHAYGHNTLKAVVVVCVETILYKILLESALQHTDERLSVGDERGELNYALESFVEPLRLTLAEIGDLPCKMFFRGISLQIMTPYISETLITWRISVLNCVTDGVFPSTAPLTTVVQLNQTNSLPNTKSS